MQRQQRGWGFFGHSIKSTRYLAYIHSHTKDRTYKVVMGGGGGSSMTLGIISIIWQMLKDDGCTVLWV